MIKYLSLIFITFVIMGVLDGFMRQVVLLTTVFFIYFICLSSLYLQIIYMEGHIGLYIDNVYQYFNTFLQACILDLRQNKKFAK